MTLIRSSPAMGLTSQPVAPRRLPSSRLAASPSVVRVRIGTKGKPGSARTFPIDDSTHYRHIDIVNNEIGLATAFNLSSAAWPWLAVSTANPLIDKAAFRHQHGN